MAAAPAPAGLGRFSALTRGWFEGAFAAPTPAQVGAWDAIARARTRWSSRRPGRARPWPRSCGRSTAWPAPRRSPSASASGSCTSRRSRPSPSTSSATSGRRWPGIRAAAARLDAPPARHHRRDAHRRHPGRGPPPLPGPPARHPHHDPRVAVPAAHLAGPRGPALRRHGDRRRGPRGGRRPSAAPTWPSASSASTSCWSGRRSASACRPPCGRSTRWPRFLGGARPVTVVAAAVARRRFDLSVVVPVEDMAAHRRADRRPGVRVGLGPARAAPAIWPARRGAAARADPRPTARPSCSPTPAAWPSGCAPASTSWPRTSSPGPTTARSAASSALLIEEDLKAGRLPAVVATSSLELGIDMGAVDLVVQVESPELGRVRPAAHRPGRPPGRGGQPRHRLPEVPRRPGRDARSSSSACGPGPSRRCATRATPSTCSPSRSWPWWRWTSGRSTTSRRWSGGRRRSPSCPAAPWTSVLDMLSGRYPSDEFAELRPRLNWDRVTRRADRRGRAPSGWPSPPAGRSPTAACSASSSPARAATRVGELDEEMVYESPASARCSSSAPRPGGSRTSPTTGCWSRPAPGQPGQDAVLARRRARPAGRARPGPRRVRARAVRPTPEAARPSGCARPAWTTAPPRNLVAYLDEQHEATGIAARRPHDRRRALPRRAGRLAGLHPLALRRPGARALGPGHRGPGPGAHSASRSRPCTPTTGSSSGCPRPTRPRPPSSILFDPEEIEDLVVEEVGGSALFASRFRECAARALLLPQRRPGQRTPLWQQRQKQRRAAPGRVASYGVVPDHARDVPRVPPGRVRPARPRRS